MTWLDIIVLAIIFICGIISFQRGFIRTLFHFVSMIISIGLTMYIYPYFSEFLMKSTGLHNSIKNSVISLLNLEGISESVISPQDQINYINQMKY